MSETDDLFSMDDLDDSDDESVAEFECPEDVSQIPSEQLCDVVISFQYLGIVQEYAIRCMKELARRRADGDAFKFEEYIATELKKLPKLDAAQSLFSTILNHK